MSYSRLSPFYNQQPVALSAKQPQIIVLLAAEPSADTLGASIARQWQQLNPSVRLMGMAGPQMRQAGVEALWNMEDVSVMGLWEVLKHYPRLKRLQTRIKQQLVALQPDVVLGIDGPDFNLAIEQYVRQHHLLAFHLVAPTVWAWRAGRAQQLAQQTDGLLCLFPFEPPYFHRYQLPAVAIGHPLADQLPLEPHKVQARVALGISSDALVLAVLPGSRRSEWHYNAPNFLQAARLLWQENPSMCILVPCLHEQMQQYLVNIAADLPIHWVIAEEGARQVLTAADVALVASGTATLETALCHTPMVMAYRMHWLTQWLMRKLIRTPWIALPNIIEQATLVPELWQEHATAERIAQELRQLLYHDASRQRQLVRFEVIHRQLKCNAALRAVQQLIEWWQNKQ